MNLTTDAWIPVVWIGGRPANVSLRDVYERGQEILDIAARPHERISLMRLLVCVAQAALDGPVDSDDWESCQPRIGPMALDYLERWQSAFALFGEKQRFLQVASLKNAPKKGKSLSELEDEDGRTPASKLDLALATGNNSTLFDNAGGSERSFTPADVALMLLTYQCFSPGGRIGVALWDGSPTPGGGSSDHAPCVVRAMLHTLLRGQSLLDSIWLNLITKRRANQFFGKGSWGKPVWESMPVRAPNASIASQTNDTYLGRLVPLARAVMLADDGQSLLLANGLHYEQFPGWREASATVITREIKGKPERQLVRASVERAAWRELHALTVKTVNQNSIGGPAPLDNASGKEAFDLWVGGLVADRAKLVDTTESVFHVPAEMLSEPSQTAYEKGVREAELTSRRVARAISVYHRELGENLDRPEMKDRRRQIHNRTIAHFWADLEGDVPRLLEVAADPTILGLNDEWSKTEWGRSVWRAAREAYERACAHETGRQIRAYAIGLGVLFASPARSSEVEAEMEAEE